MSIWCQICNEPKPCENAVQLIPCLHTFCNNCIQCVSKNAKICPALHCYSSLSTPQHYTSTCEAEKCLKRISVAPEILRTVCHHDVCQSCFDSASRKESTNCPANGCNEPMMDDEDMICEGPCKLPLIYEKFTVLLCCGARMCDDCYPKWTNGEDVCPVGKCIIKESTKRKKTPDITRQPCLCSMNCEGEVLRNFPSEFECDHDVCLGCLSTMLDECEKNGKSPYCPNKTCGVPYRCDSVLALRAQFPERKKYFSKFSLSVQFSMQTLKDETVTEIIAIDSEKNPKRNQKFTLKVGHCEEEDNFIPLDFVNDGTLGDLIREIRRVLNVLATDKIYGYYQVNENNEKKPLNVTQTSIWKTCSQLNINENTSILVDTSGIVSTCIKNK